jgi:membrane associated rhomboid family serine protease
MFLPLNDSEQNRYSGLPIMTLTLIVANLMVMVAKLFLWPLFPNFSFYNLYGSVPQFLVNEQGGGALSSITSIFIHANIFHWAGNMLFLWVFGRRIEDACGPWRYLSFYLFCGLTADLLSTLIRYKETIPGIGASGAIAGLLGAYLILFPGGRIRAFLLLGIVPTFPRVRAFWFLIYWLVIQIIPAVTVTLSNQKYSTNYWAHIGGFLGGIFVVLFLRAEAFSRFLSNEPV